MIKQKSLKIIKWSLIIALVYTTSCDTSRHSESYVSLTNLKWHKDSTVCIEMEEVDDINSSYNIALMMRHTTDFKYKNMYFFIDVYSPSGELVLRDTANIILQNPQGYWYGDGSGFLKEIGTHEIKGNYKNNTRFPEKGSYKFCITHGMRDEVLENVADLGIRIEYAN